jgi:hydrogenase-4 component A
MSRRIEIEPSRCIACGTCQAACSLGHKRVGLQDQPRLFLYQSRNVVASVTCHHCENAPCVKVCPVNAIRCDSDKAIRVDEKNCLGCKLCAIACPFGAIHLGGTPTTGVVGIEYASPTFVGATSPLLQWKLGVYSCAVKCDLCVNDPAGFPQCVTYCVTKALRLVETTETNEAATASKEVHP